ncbi:MAG TPA: MlaD family protein [Dongiaceae bacterium]|jgi:phospholipid/cholesterol/gamma-HCH transport system substrate-binding protein|nr:MlaD family protein [Dongiaceae bacterium]
MQRNVLETVMGAVVLLAAAAFLYVLYGASGVAAPSGGYHLIMRLDQGGSITPGTDVRAAGVKVGTVVRQEFDPKNFQAVITLDVDKSVELPTDSSANVDQDGLLGNAYVNLQLGSDDTMLKDGDTFKSATGALSLNKLIGMALSGSGSGGDKGGGSNP